MAFIEVKNLTKTYKMGEITIKANGEEPITRILTEEEYKKALEEKL